MKRLILGLAIFLFSSFSGCGDFLDFPEPQNAVSLEEVFENSDNIKAYFAGIYATLRRSDAGTGGHDSYGYPSIINSRNVSGNDILRTSSSWYQRDYYYRSRRGQSRRGILIWSLFYSLIDQTNVIIENLEKEDVSVSISDEEKSSFIAEAKALRGFFYYELITAFSERPYSADNGISPGIPIYEEPATIETKGNKRSSTKEVYNFIIKDLKDAVSGLTAERSNKGRINLNVAQGILARVYLEKGDWAKAASSASLARESYTLSEYEPGFNNITHGEWIWGAIFTPSTSDPFTSFTNIWSSDAYEPSYPTVTVNSTFYGLFEETDTRKATFTKKSNIVYPNKFVGKQQGDGDIPYMRVSEMYLIEAEGLARRNDPAEAKKLLYELQDHRDPGAKKVREEKAIIAAGETKTDEELHKELLEEILKERRKELWGEGLADYSDRRRLYDVEPYKHDSEHDPENDPDWVRDDEQKFFGGTCFNYQIPTDELETNQELEPTTEQNPKCDTRY